MNSQDVNALVGLAAQFALTATALIFTLKGHAEMGVFLGGLALLSVVIQSCTRSILDKLDAQNEQTVRAKFVR